MTREQILALGGSGDPWGYLPVGAQALRIAPGDDAIRYLLAANLARLGLRTLAGEQIERLGAEVRELAEVRALAGSLESLADDRVPPEELAATARANLAALGDRGDGLPDSVEAWIERGTPVHRAQDGNVIRRIGAEPHEWGGLVDCAGQIARFCGEHLGRIGSARAPVYIEGVCPPAMLQRVYGATGVEGSGYSPLLTLLQADPLEALDGLGLEDLTAVLADERVRLLVGPDAGERLRAWGRARLAMVVAGPAIAVVGTRTRCEPAVERVVEELAAEQRAELQRVRAVLDGRHRVRDRAWWSRRLGSESLRVLVPTCRHSTYIQHASGDLADAMRAAGHEAEVLIEPDAHSRMSVLAYLGAIERMDPDLIVLINYPRSGAAGGEIPADIPFVTWIQDAMPHLYDRAVGEAMGESDFVVGPIDGTMLGDYGYPAERCLAMPVVVSGRKFHDGEVGAERVERFDCEIACITHHSETPEAMHGRLKAESAADARASVMLDELFGRIRDLVGRAHEVNLRFELRELVHGLWRGEAAREDARRILRGYAIPLADRLYRHQSLEWAAGIARERGWRFHLHGNGWERHPTLAEFACGPIEHGEDLRAAYRCARVNLHVCVTSILHQRVSECFLAGGLAACRVMADHLSSAWTRARLGMVRDGVAHERQRIRSVREGEMVEVDCREFAIADSAEAMRLASLEQSLGFSSRAKVRLNERRLDGLAERLMPAWRDASRMLPVLGEHGFVDRESLERVVARAVERPAWRERVVRASAATLREHLTVDAMIERTLAMVRRSLATTGERPARAA